MPRRASLVANRSNPLVAQIVFAAKCVMVRVSSRPGSRECSQIDTAGGRQIVGSKRNLGVRIWCISGGGMDVRWEAVDIDYLARRWYRNPVWTIKTRIVVHKRRIESGVQRIGLGDAVISHSEPAADN